MTAKHPHDGSPMSHDDFLAYVKNSVSVERIEQPVVLTRDDGKSSHGTLSYTKGLQPTLGYELVAFGAYDPEDLLASAMLIAGNFPRGLAVTIPYDLLKELDESIPNVDYRQYVVDESALESDEEVVSENPLWIADGGFPILTDAELQEQLTSALQSQENMRRAGMEEVRDRYRQLIDQYGFAIVAVFDPERKQAPFLYTVGLTRKELPELIISGFLDSEFLQKLLNHFSHTMVKDGFALRKLEDVFSLGDNSKYDVRMVELDPVHALDRFLIQAQPILKQQVTRVVQLQISDNSKRWPGDPEFDNKFGQLEIAPVIAGGTPGILEA